MPLGAERERLDALQELKRVERRECRPEVAQRFHPRADDEREVAQFALRIEHVGEHQSVVAVAGLGEQREVAAAPVEAPRVYDHAAERRAVPADPLRRAVRHDVGAVLNGSHHPAALPERVVHHQRHARRVRRLRQRLEVRDAEVRVAQRLGKEGPRAVVRERGEGLWRLLRHEARLNAQPAQRDVQQVGAPTVELAAGHDVVPSLRERGERDQMRRLAAGDRERRGAAFERGDALLEHVRGRVLKAGVDVAELLQAEKPRGVVGVVEDVRRGLVDGHGPRLGRRVGDLSGVELERVEVERRAHKGVGCLSAHRAGRKKTPLPAGGQEGCRIAKS